MYSTNFFRFVYYPDLRVTNTWFDITKEDKKLALACFTVNEEYIRFNSCRYLSDNRYSNRSNKILVRRSINRINGSWQTARQSKWRNFSFDK